MLCPSSLSVDAFMMIKKLVTDNFRAVIETLCRLNDAILVLY
jgi:hypothetical protein